MKKILLSTALCASMMFAANSEYKYEITPMIGGVYTEGNLDLERNYADAGLSLGFNLDDSMFDQVELGFLRSLEDVDYTRNGTNEDTGITRVFANLVKEYGLSDSTSLYGLIGAGVEIFDNEEFDNEDGLFANYGVGIKYKISEAVALKADVRHLVEFDHGDNNLLYTVGLAIPFGKKAAPAPMMKKEPIPVITPVDVVMPKDSDGDGVVDANDKCPNTPKGDIVDETGCSLKVNLNINFDTDSAVINNSYSSKIKKFADFMKAFPSVKGKIEAHTDSDGSDAYNQKLSERRAASTVKALEAYGVEKARLNSVGYGELNPKASNETAEGKAMNRRVEGSISR
ncbi:OmpA family protein [Arcobacter sp. LA11]|uniref:OmpA family protein n=1 Tax=Arcobacter sp. LA11 TaxID=1898176 RepID=UPI000934B132|nr:OmpA family protein [Arcobacter sp. LA11]